MTGYLSPPGGQSVPVTDGLTIGRVKGCDLHLDDPKASRQHARLIVEASVVEIEDLGSSNGTMVNGKPIRRRMLRSGDVIQIGTSLITYFAEEAETAGNSSPPREGSAPARAPDRDVIEFVDERVEVRTAIVRGPEASRLHRGHGSAAGGVLRDDLRQMSGVPKLFLVVVVVLVAAALGYGAYRLAGGS